MNPIAESMSPLTYVHVYADAAGSLRSVESRREPQVRTAAR